jgi:hypothetical protein
LSLREAREIRASPIAVHDDITPAEAQAHIDAAVTR